MNAAFEGANITGFENLIETFELPDANDRHVLAAAIEGECNIIVTNNVKDFPPKYVKRFGITVKLPDDLVGDFLEENTPRVLQALDEQVRSLRNPPLTRMQVLEKLEACGLSKSVSLLTKQII